MKFSAINQADAQPVPPMPTPAGTAWRPVAQAVAVPGLGALVLCKVAALAVLGLLVQGLGLPDAPAATPAYGPWLWLLTDLPQRLGEFFAPWPALRFVVSRMGLLAGDTACYALLLAWYPRRARGLVWRYWANPALFVLTYGLGHAQIVPLGLFLLALGRLAQRRSGVSALLAGLAMAGCGQFALSFGVLVVGWWQTSRQAQATARHGALALACASAALPGGLGQLALGQSALGQWALGFAQAPGLYAALGLTYAGSRVVLANRDVLVALCGAVLGAGLVLAPFDALGNGGAYGVVLAMLAAHRSAAVRADWPLGLWLQLALLACVAQQVAGGYFP